MQEKKLINSCTDVFKTPIKVGDTVAHVQYKLHGSHTGFLMEKGIVIGIEQLAIPTSDEDYNSCFNIIIEKPGKKRATYTTPDRIIKTY